MSDEEKKDIEMCACGKKELSECKNEHKKEDQKEDNCCGGGCCGN